MKKKHDPKKRVVSKRKKKLESKRKSSRTSIPIRSISKAKNQKIRKKSTRKATTRSRPKSVGIKTRTRVVSKTKVKPAKQKIVRILGQGQFTVDNNTLKRLNALDDSIVQLVSTERSNDDEFRKRLTELTEMVQTKGHPLDPKEIIESDIILPSTDLSIDEALTIFRGEGVIPDTEV